MVGRLSLKSAVAADGVRGFFHRSGDGTSRSHTPGPVRITSDRIDREAPAAWADVELWRMPEFEGFGRCPILISAVKGASTLR
jgi:hypothetical protein